MYTQFVSKDGDHFYIDREDIETGEEICKPGDKITFKHRGKVIEGIVSNQAFGRDDDVYRVEIVA